MGRPRSWDEPTVLAAAFAVFRRNGHASTSLRELEQVTGLRPGSLYQRYGSKSGLFAAALAAYTDDVVAQRVRLHLESAPDALAGIHSFFTSTFATGVEPEPGCLLTNTAIESYSLDPALRQAVRQGLALLERGLAGAVRRAQTARQVPPEADADAVAAQLLAIYQGVLVLVRLGTPDTKLAALTGAAVDAITGRTQRSRR